MKFIYYKFNFHRRKAIFKNPIQIFCNGIFFNEFTLLSYYHELHAQDFYTRCGNLNETVKYF